jgi:hypothetical protein
MSFLSAGAHGANHLGDADEEGHETIVTYISEA